MWMLVEYLIYTYHNKKFYKRKYKKNIPKKIILFAKVGISGQRPDPKLNLFDLLKDHMVIKEIFNKKYILANM